MRKITINLDLVTYHLAKRAATAEGLSLSKWIADVLRKKTETSWPKSVLDLEGAWPDFPSLEEIRGIDSGS